MLLSSLYNPFHGGHPCVPARERSPRQTFR